MWVTLLGCGLMGRGAAHALATDARISRLTLVDLDRDRADALAGELRSGGGPVVDTAADLADSVTGRAALALAVPWAATVTAVEQADAAGVPVASITRPNYADLAGLAATRTPVLTPIGLEPGLTELVAVHLVEQARQRGDEVTAVSVYCGDIPERRHGPLGHAAFFGGELPGHLPIGQRPALATVAGDLVTRPRFSGVEHRGIEGIGRLEAYHDGMIPWLAEHPDLHGIDYTQKTLRWPGFATAVRDLARLGLLEEAAVEIDGSMVVPRRLTERVLAPLLRPDADERDVVVLEVVVEVERSGRPARWRGLLIDRFDVATGLSAIARTTGFPLAEATILLAQRVIGGRGWLKPHLVFDREARAGLLRRLQSAGMRWSCTDGLRADDPRTEETLR